MQNSLLYNTELLDNTFLLRLVEPFDLFFSIVVKQSVYKGAVSEHKI